MTNKFTKLFIADYDLRDDKMKRTQPVNYLFTQDLQNEGIYTCIFWLFPIFCVLQSLPIRITDYEKLLYTS